MTGSIESLEEEIETNPSEPSIEVKKNENPVVKWLNEVRFSGEMESLSALQSKSVAYTVDMYDAMQVRNSQVAIQTLKANSSDLIKQIVNLIEMLPLEVNEFAFARSRLTLIYDQLCNIIDFCKRRLNCPANEPVYSHKSSSKASPVQLSNEMLLICQQMIAVLNLQHVKKPDFIEIETSLRVLIDKFGKLIDQTIKRDCKVICDTLYRHDKSVICIKWCLSALLQLTHEDNYICRIFTEYYPVVKSLINFILLKPNPSIPRIQWVFMGIALRIMSHLCVNSEAVRQIYTHTAIEQRLIILLNETNDNVLISEAIRLLFQITQIFVQYKQADDLTKEQLYLYEEILNKRVVDSLVECLTRVLSTTNSREIFLLTMAVFSHISFYECYPFIRHRTLNILLQAFENRVTNFVDEIAIKDQTLTFLANVSEKYPVQILESGALVYLINSLKYCQANTLSKEQFDMALERVQIKTATALGNLASDPALAQFILKYNGVSRLVALIKDGKSRNFSVNVLDAAVKALRRIAYCLGPEYLGHQHYIECLDLLKLPVEEIIYRQSTRNELYV